jgi:hypothetical protein
VYIAPQMCTSDTCLDVIVPCCYLFTKQHAHAYYMTTIFIIEAGNAVTSAFSFSFKVYSGGVCERMSLSRIAIMKSDIAL